MTETEAKQLTEIVEQLKAINNKLDALIGKEKTDSQELKDRSIVNGLLHICTHKEYTDEQYCNALKQLKDLDFALSPKQMAWILCYTLRHATCGDSIRSFIQSEIDRVEDKNKFVDTICFELRKNYSNEKNAEYLEGVVGHLKKLV